MPGRIEIHDLATRYIVVDEFSDPGGGDDIVAALQDQGASGDPWKIGAVVGHEGTDANGKVTNTGSGKSNASMAAPDGTVRAAQAALEAQGYSPGSIDGQFGPNTHSALRKFQADKGLPQTGSLDSATKTALGI